MTDQELRERLIGYITELKSIQDEIYAYRKVFEHFEAAPPLYGGDFREVAQHLFDAGKKFDGALYKLYTMLGHSLYEEDTRQKEMEHATHD